MLFVFTLTAVGIWIRGWWGLSVIVLAALLAVAFLPSSAKSRDEASKD